jgi:hypothetical protein
MGSSEGREGQEALALAREAWRVSLKIAAPLCVVALAVRLPSAFALEYWEVDPWNPGRQGDTSTLWAMGLALLDIVLLAFEQGTVAYLALRALEDKPVGLPTAAWAAWRRLWNLIEAHFLASIQTTILMLFLVIPGVFRMLSYAAVFPILMSETCSGPGALRESRLRMAGLRWTYFKAIWPAWALVVGVLFGGGELVGALRQAVGPGGLSEAIRWGSVLVLDGGGELVWLWSLVVGAVLYHARLRPRRSEGEPRSGAPALGEQGGRLD